MWTPHSHPGVLSLDTFFIGCSENPRESLGILLPTTLWESWALSGGEPPEGL